MHDFFEEMVNGMHQLGVVDRSRDVTFKFGAHQEVVSIIDLLEELQGVEISRTDVDSELGPIMEHLVCSRMMKLGDLGPRRDDSVR